MTLTVTLVCKDIHCGSLLMKPPIVSKGFTDDNHSISNSRERFSIVDLIVSKLAFSKYCAPIEHNIDIDAKVREP